MEGEVRRTIIEGLPQDPPGEPSGHFNDDATRASAYRKKKAHLDPAVPPSRQQQQHMLQLAARKQQFKLQQPKSIIRYDLEDIKPTSAVTPTKTPWEALLPGTISIPIPACTIPAKQPPAASVPLRPCDIPRGSEMKKQDATFSFSAFLSQFGL